MQILRSGIITFFGGTSISVPVASYPVLPNAISADFLLARFDFRGSTTIGALIIRLGFGAHYAIIRIRDPW